MQALFENFLSCDVMDSANHSQGFFSLYTYDLATTVDPKHLAVRSHNAVLEVNRFILVGSIGENRSEQIPIFRMKHLRLMVEGGGELVWFEPVDAISLL